MISTENGGESNRLYISIGYVQGTGNPRVTFDFLFN